ncbi:hypothetical protein [Breznakia blatticola]|nr:hypothetical protein [Breznakia blatticola]
MPKGEEYETKAMLYLMNTLKNKSVDDIFLVDMFNDISASTLAFEYIIDAQAKNYTSFNASKIGESLITLFSNHLSNIYFKQYVLYCRVLPKNYLITPDTGENFIKLDINCFKPKKKDLIMKSFYNEIDKSYGHDYHKSIEEKVYFDFFSNLEIVVDSRTKSEHVINSLPVKALESLDDAKLEMMFGEITTMRMTLKLICVENEKINSISECEKYKKYIKRKNIESFIISRVIGYDLFNNDIIGTPLRFSNNYLNEKGHEEQKDIILSIYAEISRAFFNLNNPVELFSFLDVVVEEVRKRDDVEYVYQNVMNKITNLPSELSELSSKYIISVTLGGYYDN